MNYKEGLVSIIIPTYKRSDKLSRAIESVLNQTYTNIELLLVNDNEPNDCYSNELLTRIKKYENDERFRFIEQEKHINGAVARNVGIRLAQGEYIAFLDDDDWWEKEKLEKQVSVLKTLPAEWGGVSCKYRFFDMNGNIIGKTRKYKDGNIYKDILFLLSDVATGTICLRRKALDDTGYFDENLMRHQDLQLLINFTYKYKLKELDEFLHCCDISDTQNRPDAEKLIEHKRRFFSSIMPILNSMKKNDVKCVYCIHDFEVGYVFLKSKKVKMGIKYCSSIFKMPKAFYYAIKKSIIKILLSC